MKRINILTLVVFVILLTFVPLMAQDVTEQPDWVMKIVEALMPLILLAVVSVSKLKNEIPGILMLVVIGGLSAVATFFVNLAGEPSVPWYLYLVYNTSGTFFHQLYKQLESGN